jgi:general secretion pathway protein B
MDGTPTYAPEIPLAAVESARAPEPTPATRKARATHHSRTPALEAPVEQDEVLPTIGELNLTGSDALPELHLDVHVYATIPADRFVYVNNRKYREGMRLQEGPTVERIRRDGVVLNSQGTFVFCCRASSSRFKERSQRRRRSPQRRRSVRHYRRPQPGGAAPRP